MRNPELMYNKKTLKETIKNAVRGFIRYMNVKTGHIRSNHVRNFIYRNFFLVRMAQCAMIRSGAVMRASHNLQISKGAIIGFNAILDATNGLRIGENANISEGVWIWTEQHNVNDEWFSCKGAGGPVVIGNRAWISSRVVILPRVTIGEGAVVAAGAVVTKNIEPFSIYGGIPAKKIGERNRDLKYEFAGNYLSLN